MEEKSKRQDTQDKFFTDRGGVLRFLEGAGFTRVKIVVGKGDKLRRFFIDRDPDANGVLSLQMERSSAQFLAQIVERRGKVHLIIPGEGGQQLFARGAVMKVTGKNDERWHFASFDNKFHRRAISRGVG